MTRVVHCKVAPPDSYVYIGRPSIYGNPFRLKHPGNDIERAWVLVQYREYFTERIERDAAFRRAVEDLRGLDLGCWCAPRKCHGDVILEWLEEHP